MGEDGYLFAQVRSSLASTLLYFDDRYALYMLPVEPCPRIMYLFFFDGGSRGIPGLGGSVSVIVQLQIPTHFACVLCVSSKNYGSAVTTYIAAEYWGLVHGLRQAKTSSYSPLHAIWDSEIVLSQLWT